MLREMNSFELDNYVEPEMLIAKEQDEKSPLVPFNNGKKSNKKKVKIIKLLRKK